VPIVQEAVWAPGSVWTGAENLAPTGIRSPDRPARSLSLYRQSCTAHELVNYILYIELIIMLYAFAERTELLLNTVLLTTYCIAQIPNTDFSLYLLINCRVQTRAEIKHNTHIALMVVRVSDALCAYNAHAYQQDRAIWK
jgi:hypothetical protein